MLAWWRWSANTSTGQPAARLLPRSVLVPALLLAVIFGVLRNLPAGSWLAPPAG